MPKDPSNSSKKRFCSPLKGDRHPFKKGFGSLEDENSSKKGKVIESPSEVSCRQLFLTFVKIGAFTFGGGHAMLPLIQRDIVEKHRWVSQEEFIDLFAVAQSLPGVFAVNISMFIGHKLRGTKGAVVSSLGSTLPSFVIILLLAFFFEGVRDNRIVSAVMKGIRPAVVAMIAIPIISIWQALKLPPYMLLIPIGVAVAVWYFGVSPVWIILLAGVLGLLYQARLIFRTHHRKSE